MRGLAGFFAVIATPAMAEVCDKASVVWSLGLGAVPHPNLSVWAVWPLTLGLCLVLLSWMLLAERWGAALGVLALGALASFRIYEFYWDPSGLTQFAHKEGCVASPVVVAALCVGGAGLIAARPWRKRL